MLPSNMKTYPVEVDRGTLAYVTSLKTLLTYKNRYCALCSLEDKTDLLEWSLQANPQCTPRRG